MDQFQSYSQALQESLSSVQQPEVEKPEELQTPAQLVGSTVLEGVGTDILREGIGETKEFFKKKALSKLGFSEDEADEISSNGLKGLKNVLKGRLQEKLDPESFSDREIKAGLRNNESIGDDADAVFKNLKDPEAFNEKFKAQFPESELTDDEIEATRLKGLSKYGQRGRNVLSEGEGELKMPELPKIKVPEIKAPSVDLPDVEPGYRVLSDVEGLQRRLPTFTEQERQFRPASLEEVDPEDLTALPSAADIAEVSGTDLSGTVSNLTSNLSGRIGQIGQTAQEAASGAEEAAGESLAKAAAKTAIKTGAEEAGEAAGEIAGEGLLDAALGPVGIAVGLGTMIAGLFLHKRHHDRPDPVPGPRINPSVQFGLLP